MLSANLANSKLLFNQMNGSFVSSVQQLHIPVNLSNQSTSYPGVISSISRLKTGNLCAAALNGLYAGSNSMGSVHFVWYVGGAGVLNCSIMGNT